MRNLRNRLRNIEDNIESIHIKSGPDEILTVYVNDKAVGHLFGKGNIWMKYDKTKVRIRTEKMYLP